MFLQGLIIVLAFLVLGGVSFFLWWKSKGMADMLMMAGFGAAFVVNFFFMLGIYFGGALLFWINCVGLAAAAFGFLQTFWPKIKDDVMAMKAKAQAKMHKDAGAAPPPPAGGSAPPPAAPPPPPPPPPPA